MTPENRQQLRGALLSAFPTRSKLEQMLSLRLDWRLEEIAAPGNLGDVVFELLKYAEAKEQIDDLLQAASADNPGNLQLKDARAALLTGTVSQPSAPAKPEVPVQAAATPQKTPFKLISCYASRDTRYAVELETFLDALVKVRDIEPPWSEARITPGAVRGEEIKRRWQAAEIIVLLVSADFLNSKSDFLTLAEERMRAGAAVVPVIIRPALWQLAWIGQGDTGIQVLPRDDKGEVKPISKWTDEGDAWVQVVEGLQTIIAARRGRQSPRP